MKAFEMFLDQPYATAVVRGLRNAIPYERFNRGDRIYINAVDSFKEPAAPLEWLQEVNNHVTFGNLPSFFKLTRGKCVGFVDVLCDADGRESCWSHTAEPSVIVTNAHEFDVPQPIIIRNWRDAEDIPSHVFRSRSPHAFGRDEELVIPVNPQIYSKLTKRSVLTLELTHTIEVQVLDEEARLINFDKFTLACGQFSKSFLWNVGCDIVWEWTPDGEDLVYYPSVYCPSGEAQRGKLLLPCCFPLNV